MKKPRPTYLYALRDPVTRVVRYVGITRDPAQRLGAHLNRFALKRPSHKNHWLRGLVARGMAPLLTILAETDEHAAPALEIATIAAYRAAGYNLTNVTMGGEGVRGLVHSAQTRAKITAKQMGKPRPGNKGSPAAIAASVAARKGKPLSAEHRAKISVGVGTPKGMLGKHHTPEWCARQSERFRGRPSPTTGMTFTDQTRAKMSASAKVNRRVRGKRLTAFGESKILVDWAVDPRCVVTCSTLQARLARGKRLEDALTMPLAPGRWH